MLPDMLLSWIMQVDNAESDWKRTICDMVVITCLQAHNGGIHWKANAWFINNGKCVVRQQWQMRGSSTMTNAWFINNGKCVVHQQYSKFIRCIVFVSLFVICSFCLVCVCVFLFIVSFIRVCVCLLSVSLLACSCVLLTLSRFETVVKLWKSR